MSSGRYQRNFDRFLADEKVEQIQECDSEISKLEAIRDSVKAKRDVLTAELDALIGRRYRTVDAEASSSSDQSVLTFKKARLTSVMTIGTQTEPQQ